MLEKAGIDLIEISGGTYEAPEMSGINQKDSTREREAYFLRYAEQIRARVKVPLMVTGGFRSAAAMASAIGSGATDLVGLARALAIDPDFCKRILNGEEVVSQVKPRVTGIKAIDSMAMLEVIWYSRQLQRMGAGKEPRPGESPLWALLANTVVSSVKGVRTPKLRV